MTRALLPVLLTLLIAAAPALAQPAPGGDSLYVLHADSLDGDGRDEALLTREWRFSPRDDSTFARPGYDDSGWPVVNALLDADEMPDGWDGLGWFRLHFRVDSSLAGVPLGLSLVQRGASEVFLDGERLFSVGTVGETAETTTARLQRFMHAVPSLAPGRHTLAVRYANHRTKFFHEGFRGNDAGFYVLAGDVNAANANQARTVRTVSALQLFFVGVLLSFAFLHLVLYAFNRAADENLVFAILTAAAAGLAYVIYQRVLTTDPAFLYHREQQWLTVAFVTFLVAGPLFLYRVFYEKLPRLAYVVVGLGLVATAPFFLPRIEHETFVTVLQVVFYGFWVLASLEMLRVVGRALWRGQPGARIIGAGMAGLVGCFFFVLALDVNLISFPSSLSVYYGNAIPFVGVLLLIVASSVQLSRQSAETSRDLRRRLREVETLTEEKVEQERRRERLKAEYDRKLEELEEARRLQLSMLPQKMPALDGYELAAHMETAEEVGGDYYDFDLSENGTGGALTLAVGDATGHGLSAGTMVTATKSLFQALGSEADLLPMLRRAGRALKAMNLRRLYMALTVARLGEDGRLRLATAGMPPALVYRAKSGKVETIRLKGMPLGSFPDFPYREQELTLNEGDAVVLMSDGFPERFNPQGEMLGYERAAEVLADAGCEPAQAIIDRFVEESERWADGRPTDDDLTFVALKRAWG